MKLNVRKEAAQETLLFTALGCLRALFLIAILLTILPSSGKTQTTQAGSDVHSNLAIAEAIRLFEEGTPTALRAAVKKLEEAIPLLHATGDTQGEADLLMKLTSVHDASHQAPAIHRALNDRAGQASVLQQIRYLHLVQEEYPQAFTVYDEAPKNKETERS